MAAKLGAHVSFFRIIIIIFFNTLPNKYIWHSFVTLIYILVF